MIFVHLKSLTWNNDLRGWSTPKRVIPIARKTYFQICLFSCTKKEDWSLKNILKPGGAQRRAEDFKAALAHYNNVAYAALNDVQQQKNYSNKSESVEEDRDVESNQKNKSFKWQHNLFNTTTRSDANTFLRSQFLSVDLCASSLISPNFVVLDHVLVSRKMMMPS